MKMGNNNEDRILYTSIETKDLFEYKNQDINLTRTRKQKIVRSKINPFTKKRNISGMSVMAFIANFFN